MPLIRISLVVSVCRVWRVRSDVVSADGVSGIPGWTDGSSDENVSHLTWRQLTASRFERVQISSLRQAAPIPHHTQALAQKPCQSWRFRTHEYLSVFEPFLRCSPPACQPRNSSEFVLVRRSSHPAHHARSVRNARNLQSPDLRKLLCARLPPELLSLLTHSSPLSPLSLTPTPLPA